MPEKFKIKYTHNLWFCRRPRNPALQKIHIGDEDSCKKECALNSVCKSFDYCYKNPKETFCHLKDESTEDFQKTFKTGNGHSDYYECRGNTKPYLVTLDKPIYIVGENQQRGLKNCKLSERNVINCDSQLKYNPKTGLKDYTKISSGTIGFMNIGNQFEAMFGSEQ